MSTKCWMVPPDVHFDHAVLLCAGLALLSVISVWRLKYEHTWTPSSNLNSSFWIASSTKDQLSDSCRSTLEFFKQAESKCPDIMDSTSNEIPTISGDVRKGLYVLHNKTVGIPG
ncbi:hypothetical protein RvY_06763 [Ramazzottius varieornatus]|uniref:Uncharacterized protein n=1 Tax=Ramazzottius varieornatus TaxID=947166 RepID=A0A1D1UZR1_RAMVA|nr:hypothetical protein RvY_06763 [Ramazzottius varieornatus]